MGLAKIFFSVLILAYTNGFAATTIQEQFSPTIIGGVDAVKDEIPFQASIQYDKEGHGCGGSLIASNWVLTAGHCVHGYVKEKMRVVMGLHDRTKTENSETFEIEDMVIHPNYGAHDLEFDLALIKLKGNSEFTPVSLNQEELNLSPVSPIKAWVSGWGTTRQGNFKLPKILQKLELPLVRTEECNKPASYDGAINETQICAGFQQGRKDSCQCDSGGPLFLKKNNNEFLLIGIVSYGEGCAKPDKYGVYTKVNFFYDWIQQQITE